VGQIFNSTGCTGTAFWWTLVATPITVLAFVGLSWGIEGVAACYGVVSVGLTFFSFRIAFMIVGLKVQSLVPALWRPLARALLMAASVFAVDRIALAGTISGVLRLGSDISLGATIYLVLSAIFNSQDLMEIFEQIILLVRSTMTASEPEEAAPEHEISGPIYSDLQD